MREPKKKIFLRRKLNQLEFYLHKRARKGYKRSLNVKCVKENLQNSILSRVWTLIFKKKKMKRNKRQEDRLQYGCPVVE